MNKRLLLFLAIGAASCSLPNEDSRLHGDYYIKFIDMRPHDWPDSVLTSIEEAQSTSSDTLTHQQTQFVEFLAFLKMHGLLRKPHIYIRQEDGNIQTLFLSREDYDRIMLLDSNLVESEMRIVIATEVKPIKFDTLVIYESVGYVEMEKKPGQTYWEK